MFGASRAFFSPASTALGPMLVPRPLLPRAIAWNSLAWQTASIAGPAAGGFLLVHSPQTAYFTTFGLYIVSMLSIAAIRKSGKPTVNPGSRWALMKEGLAYVWRQKIVFGAISLDLFAVLLGGATALLPVFARDILHVGPEGFGILRSGPAIGATVIALLLAANPIRKHAGVFMFGGVAVFGLATVVFAVSHLILPSHPLWLAVGALAVLGGADMLSVYVRQTLVQLVTPDAMRGRGRGGLVGIHRGLQRARRVRERRGRPLPGPGGRGAVRRGRRAHRHRRLGQAVSRLAQGGPPRITVSA